MMFRPSTNSDPHFASRLAVSSLVAVNALLAVSLGLKWAQPSAAVAQPAASRPSELTVITAQARGTPPSVLYVLDPVAGRLSFMTYEDAGGVATFGQAPVDLEKVFAQTPLPAGRPSPRR